jgi:hypothetical protein
MLKSAFFLVPATFLAAFSAHAQDSQTGSRAEVQMSNDTLQMRYLDNGEHVNAAGNGQASAAFFLSEERDIVLSGDLLFPARLDFAPPLGIRFGPRGYAALLEDENNDVMALSVGLEARWELHRNSGLAIAGHAFYAPDIMTFGSADNLTDLGARLEIRAAPRLTVFGGMRWFEFDLTDGSGERTLQEEVFVGAGWRF